MDTGLGSKFLNPTLVVIRMAVLADGRTVRQRVRDQAIMRDFLDHGIAAPTMAFRASHR
jgi:hypothetical protein